MLLRYKVLPNILRDIYRAQAQALEFLTILPLSRFYKSASSPRETRASPSSSSASASSHFFWLERHGWSASICGLLIGSVCGLCAIISFQFLPSFLCVCLTLCCGMILSGALHEDGLADAVDALGVPIERRVLVMESPEVGSFAVLALILSFSIRAASLSFLLDDGLETLVLSLLLLHLSSRSAFALWFRFGLRFGLRFERSSGRNFSGSMRSAHLASLIGRPSLFSVFSAVFVCSFFSFIFLPLFSSVIFLSVFVVCSVFLLLFFVRFFDGVSGDLCGFGEQVLECVLSMSLCAIILH